MKIHYYLSLVLAGLAFGLCGCASDGSYQRAASVDPMFPPAAVNNVNSPDSVNSGTTHP